MARTFHRKERLAALTEINMTPLIDLAFSLLIIFMITTPLLEQTIPVELPLESVSPQQNQRDEFQVVSINIRGEIHWGEQQVTEAQLADLLDEFAKNPDPPVLSIRADARLRYQRVVTLIDMIKKRQLSKISLDTRAE